MVLLCLFHDIPEARTGDLNYVNKKYVKVAERKAVEDLAGANGGAFHLLDLTPRPEADDPDLARLVELEGEIPSR